MAELTVKRPERPKALISLVPMIDVMLILLVFFMVTSTYLNLDMIPAVRQEENTGAASVPAGDGPPPILVRIGVNGAPAIRGQELSLTEFSALITQRLASEPLTQLVLLPSGGARTQALISLMDRATQAGVTRLRVIRLEARP